MADRPSALTAERLWEIYYQTTSSKEMASKIMEHCVNCGRHKAEHIRDQCLFSPDRFTPYNLEEAKCILRDHNTYPRDKGV